MPIPPAERVREHVAASEGAAVVDVAWLAEVFAIRHRRSIAARARRLVGIAPLGRDQSEAIAAALAGCGIEVDGDLSRASKVRLTLAPSASVSSRGWRDRIPAVLQSPAVVFLGFVATILTIVPFLWHRLGLDTPSPPAPARLNGELNIVVAPFAARGMPTLVGSDLAAALARDLKRAFARQQPGPGGLDLLVAVGGPERLAAIDGRSAVERSSAADRVAHLVNAHVVAYAVADRRNGFSHVDSYVYVPADFVAGSEQLSGEYPLGRVTGSKLPIDQDIGLRRALRRYVTGKVSALGTFITGLKAYAGADYEAAVRFLAQSDEPGLWPSRDGLGMVKLFAANAEGKLGNYRRARAHYLAALALKPGWARPRLGLAEVDLHEGQGDCGQGAQAQRLKRVRTAFLGLTATREATTAGRAIRVRALLGAARAALCLSRAAAVDAWDDADRRFRDVLAVIGPRTTIFGAEAAEAHAGLGVVALQRPGAVDRAAYRFAERHYRAAAMLTDDPARRRIFMQTLAFIRTKLPA